MTAALFFFQDVNLATEFGVGMNGAGFAQNLTSLDLGSLNAAEQGTNVVASLSVIQDLAEHLDAGNDNFSLLIGQTNDLNLIGSFQLA